MCVSVSLSAHVCVSVFLIVSLSMCVSVCERTSVRTCVRVRECVRVCACLSLAVLKDEGRLELLKELPGGGNPSWTTRLPGLLKEKERDGFHSENKKKTKVLRRAWIQPGCRECDTRGG